jgi:signal peptidase I
LKTAWTFRRENGSMTSPSVDAGKTSPWLSVWLSPRATIGRIVAADPRRQVWLLSSLGLMSSVAIQVLLGPWAGVLLDWRALAGLVLFGAIFGIIGLYYFAFFLRSSGELLGGRASAAEIRAALAWGQLPVVLGVVVLCLAVLASPKLFGGSPSRSDMQAAAISLTVVAAELWAVIITWLMLARVNNLGYWRAGAGAVIGWVAAWLVVVLLFAIPFRTFVLQPFNIPSGSMTPTLQVGDYLFVAKYPYGYTRYSLPFSPPLFSGRILAAEPQRGDVVVYRLPKDDTVDYISRIVGLPGDRIQMIDGRLNINGEPVKRERAEDFSLEQDGRTVAARRWRETLPNGVSHETLDLQDNGFLDNTAEFKVPAGHYFMMGDNRDNASDSRLPSQVGYVPFENLVGRAALIVMSIVPDPRSGERTAGFQRFGPVR